MNDQARAWGHERCLRQREMRSEATRRGPGAMGSARARPGPILPGLKIRAPTETESPSGPKREWPLGHRRKDAAARCRPGGNLTSRETRSRCSQPALPEAPPIAPARGRSRRSSVQAVAWSLTPRFLPPIEPFGGRRQRSSLRPVAGCGGGRGATPFLARWGSPFRSGLGFSGPTKWVQGGPWRCPWPQALAWLLRLRPRLRRGPRKVQSGVRQIPGGALAPQAQQNGSRAGPGAARRWGASPPLSRFAPGVRRDPGADPDRP